ncbi:hypothetical protein AAZX31_18G271600 [Glycine max]|uniref:putative [ribosomal protein S5]-alanine N-acetyltransferase n=1 Tax=Glycine max TaxID=3847 RepID=UPI000233DFAA|nr:putative [ribosomal protein S5]-alanine N-acetyltransferase [Glycine max]KAG4922927.1 hypothetical protein JHK86_051740 [Glycine max]KAH1200360.1 putative ribosomal-protein-alanine acetyltransferase [Glycine max]|eukprot:XP_003551826.1 uncharacterized protein LOC100802886 [Glycine max]
MVMAIDLSRISVRPFKASEEADDVLLWLGDARVTQYTRLETCGSRSEALTFLKDECVYPLRRSICLDDRSIGIVWVLPYSGDERYKADLGYALGVNYWGNGIATKALKIVLSQVFHDFPHLRRLQAYTYLDNKASQRVLEKVGFHREGIIRDLYFKGKSDDFYIFRFLSTDEIPSLIA